MRALIIAALLSTMPAHAATSADVEREISGAFSASEIDSRERWALAFTLLATAADVYTSERGQRGGCRESGAIYGDHTDAADYIVPTLVATGVQVWAYGRQDMPNAHWFGWVYGAFRLAGAAHNASLDCYRR